MRDSPQSWPLSAPLAVPERFEEAHRLMLRAVEILDRDGFRDPPVAEPAAEFVARFIVRSFTKSLIEDLWKLYAQRESQAEPGTPERHSPSRARIDVQRLESHYSGGGDGAPLLLAAGAAIPALASLGQQVGAIDLNAR
jgi:hypothetical protein